MNYPRLERQICIQLYVTINCYVTDDHASSHRPMESKEQEETYISP